MSKRGGGVNRVCFPCRLKFPSQFTTDSKNYNVTSVCSECGCELTNISDSYRVPPRIKIKAWAKLEKDVLKKTLITPMCSGNRELLHKRLYPEHCRIDRSNNVFRGEAKYRAMKAYDEATKRDPELLKKVVDMHMAETSRIDIIRELAFTCDNLIERKEIRKTISLALTYASYKHWIANLRARSEKK